MSYFACDRAESRLLVPQLAQAIERQTGLHWFALVDTAFDHGARPMPWPHPVAPLYCSGRLAELSSVSPCLYALAASDDDSWRSELHQLLDHAGGRPMLSFLGSRLDAPQLAGGFQQCLEAQTSDSQSLLLRLADTRVLPALAASLSPANWARVGKDAEGWHFIDRRGHLQALPLPAADTSPEHASSPLSLSDDEFSTLLVQTLPDALIQAMHERFEDLLPQANRADFHDLMVRVCRLCDQHGIEAFPDRLALAIATAGTEGHLLEVPELNVWLGSRPWQDGSFEDALARWMEAAP